MNRIVIGALAALMLVATGVFWWQGRASEGAGATVAPLALASVATGEAEDLPKADLGDMVGPGLPQANEATREQRRFDRLDKDRDNRITRNEMLSPRVKDFRKLDTDGNNLLTFEEWAVATSNKFKAADVNGDQALNREEYATTKTKIAKEPVCKCK
jgi:EF hand